MEQDQKEWGGGSKMFFKFDKTGNYKLRVLTNPKALATHFFGKGFPSSVCYGMEKGCPFHNPENEKASVKYQAYVIDREDNQIKLAELPWSVMARIGDFEEDDELAFEEFPMPMDIKVKVNKESTDKKGVYTTDASITKIPITTEEDNLFIEKMKVETVEQFVENKKIKQLAKHKADGTWDKEAEKRKEFLNKVEVKKPSTEEVIEYPPEEINPDDIPF